MTVESIASRTCKDGVLEHRLTVTPIKTAPSGNVNIYEREGTLVVGWLVKVFCVKVLETINAQLTAHLRARDDYYHNRSVS